MLSPSVRPQKNLKGWRWTPAADPPVDPPVAAAAAAAVAAAVAVAVAVAGLPKRFFNHCKKIFQSMFGVILLLKFTSKKTF